jgi:hypothetical protein
MTQQTVAGTFGAPTANPDGSYSEPATIQATDATGRASVPLAITLQFPPPPLIRPRPVLPTGLTEWTKGDLVIATPGDVVQNVDVVNGRIVYKTANARVTNFIARGGKNPGYSTGLIDCTDANAVGCTFSHGLFLPNNPAVGWDGVMGHGISGDDFEVQGTIDGLGNFNTHGPGCNCRFTNGLIHNLVRLPDKGQPNGWSHSDGDQDQGETGLYMRNMDITGITSALMIGGNVGPITGLDIQQCWLNSSMNTVISYATVNITLRPLTNPVPVPNMGTISRNRFGRGGLHPVAIENGAGIILEGNVWDDTGLPIPIKFQA